VFMPGPARTVCWRRSACDEVRRRGPGRAGHAGGRLALVFTGQPAVQHQRAVGRLDHPPFRDRHEPGQVVAAFDDLDVDAQERAVDRNVVFEPGVDPGSRDPRGVLTTLSSSRSPIALSVTDAAVATTAMISPSASTRTARPSPGPDKAADHGSPDRCRRHAAGERVRCADADGRSSRILVLWNEDGLTSGGSGATASHT
jgi:uncharacterized protein RhaS with RHS repeats